MRHAALVNFAAFLSLFLFNSNLFAFAGGDGTTDNPYQISTQADLEAVNDDLEASYLLVNDIDLSGTIYNHSVIGRLNYIFKGNFDGNGHVISNLLINTSESSTGATGFFRGIKGYDTEVKNLGLNNITILSNSYSYAGGFAGFVTFSTVSNCYVTGSFKDARLLGGFCGQANSSLISNCYVNGFVEGNPSSGDVLGFGGFCGWNDSSIIENCYFSGSVKNLINIYDFGGFCGKNKSGSFKNCYFDNLSGPQNGYATSLGILQMQESESFEGFDFAGVPEDGNADYWEIEEGYLPKLSWQKDAGPLPGDLPLTTLSGTGGTDDPFLINNYEDFDEFCNNGNLEYGCYSLTVDIDLAGKSFSRSPIDRVFWGTFDGNGNIISNMSIDAGGEDVNYLALFRYIAFGRIHELGIENVNISGGERSSYNSAISGYNYCGSISSCYSSGEIVLGGNASYIGGISGYNRGGLISDCYFNGIIVGGEFAKRLGGICGYNDSVIQNCYFLGSLTAGYGSVDTGAICGYNWSDNVKDCYYHVFAGFGYDCGTPLIGLQMQDRSSYDGFDFAAVVYDGHEEIWDTVEGHCPKLVWQSGNGPVAPSDPQTSLTGSGAKDDPFIIADYVDLMEFAENEQLIGGYYLLVSDIDLGGIVFDDSVIDRYFAGQFDGAFHDIKNMNVKTADDTVAAGFFAGNNGRIQRLGVVDYMIDASGIRSSKDSVGGLAACNSGVVRECFTDGSIINTFGSTGGLCGSNFGEIGYSYSESIIEGKADIGCFVGVDGGFIHDCYSGGSITLDSLYPNSYNVGGFCGNKRGGNFIRDCYSTAAVINFDKPSYVGFIGDDDWVFDSFWDVETSGVGEAGDIYGGLIGLSTEQMQTQSSFEPAFEFADFNTGKIGWYMPEDSYPLLYWQNSEASLMPDVSGINIDDAQVVLQGTGFIIGEVKYVDSMTVPVDAVAGISVIMGGYVDRAVPIDLFVSTGITGKGTETEPFAVACRADLDMVNRDLTANYIQTADIIIENGFIYRHTVIAICEDEEDVGFSGKYDGRDCVIYNLIINGDKFAGLFGKVDVGGYVCNLNLTNASIDNLNVSSSRDVCGSIVGLNYGSIVDCSFDGLMPGSFNCGGICGTNYGLILSCHARGIISSRYSTGGVCAQNAGTILTSSAECEVHGEEEVGGFCGYNAGDIDSCCSNSKVKAQRGSGGGFCGRNQGNITNSYSLGAVEGESTIGGFCGENDGYISQSYSATSAPGEDDSDMGGFTGSGHEVMSCFWDIEVSGIETSDSGDGKTTAQMQNTGTFLDAGWDYVGESGNGEFDVWYQRAGDYPRLHWQARGGDLNCDGFLNDDDYSLFLRDWGVSSTATFRSYSDLNYDGVSDNQDLAILSRSWTQWSTPLSDINGDGIIDIEDFWLLTDNWLAVFSGGEALAADINGDGFVDMADLGMFANAWRDMIE
ncbi:hypothetical protein SMSP2_00538 [Limihaloglobus sulfuriphilus]|uniref:PASTA domain-containing protein n=1 Tax=Limihaloglobus sulfuriphilus TaxID=1851148 RepID=A0A1Q2MBT9_9BACT|nr:GLUG motif-containing protein [Limihaloglobus sulfuriphilus]AQQ70195.1 hypothetical protein SMSP2_00538 [Limihaloglobus sulfuriphilus]